ncbi:MAG: porin family protein [Proteobacteria bacterium]|nr:porin family protein [Pseudomonadota bacterium]
MKLRRLSVLLVESVLMVCLLGHTALAEFYVGVGIPYSYTFSKENSDGRKFEADTVSGKMVHIQFSPLFGLGLESYEVKLKNSGFTQGDLNVETLMLDAYYNLNTTLDLTEVVILLGVGYGRTEMKCSVCSDYFNDGEAMQLYAQVGLPISESVDVHLAYQMVASKITSKVVDFEANLDGNLISLGIGITF